MEFDSEDYLLNFDAAIAEFVPNHGLAPEDVATLSREWNMVIRENGSTTPDHQGKKSGKQSARSLPRSLARKFFRERFGRMQRRAVMRRQAEIQQLQLQIAAIQAQIQQSQAAAQDVLALEDPKTAVED